MENDKKWIADTIDKIVSKISWVSEKSKNKIPYTTVEGVHDNRLDSTVAWTPDNGRNWWTNGFFAGMMWQMYVATDDKKYIDIARFSEEQLDQCFDDFYGINHDAGFMWLPTAVADYRLTGNEASKRRGLHAANLLAGRFNPAGDFIRAWNDFGDGRDTKGWAIIDCLMNIPLLYWADKELKDCRYYNVATKHADTAKKYFVRNDGSVNHIVEFNPQTGEYIGSHGGQGYGHGSSWTRGQAWAIYGFALSFRHTSNKEYLDAAKRVAHYFIANIPESGLIPVDFRQPETPEIEDSTAAAIAACGLLEVASHVGEYEVAVYEVAAKKLLRTLSEKRCNFGPDNDCILENCTASYDEKQHEYNIIYGDYFYMEGMFRLNGKWADIW
ncbi:glycoside hydrolase family 88 protein [[Clostridium] fimetarium]|uniref:Unsaturated chondroitin disaccharide hydrolase n=1 Tax=[Clostridium] fimetarium TaxID=99656 RepID=A0A1I0NNC5_9FIRM|nr:glycoside hydrolase family 88 protein [[Clostridium] fimetarium]SEW02703.1 unsaturated chondroitin disaccharide hydrolase [[Clostridium] fimetarium]